MKSFKFLLVVMLLALPFLVLAQTAAPVVPVEPPAWMPPQWLVSVLEWVQKLPKVGPVVVQILMWLSVVAVVLTAIHTAMLAVLKGLTPVLNMVKLEGLAKKINDLYEKVAPYIKYLSMYNAQLPKKEDKKEEKPNA